MIHKRKSNRLKEYNYSNSGYYFVTVCTKDKKECFGKIVDIKMVLSEIGKIVEQCWREIPKHFSFVKLDEYIVMPNHIHGIIVIVGNEYFYSIVGNENLRSLQGNTFKNWSGAKSCSLSSIIRGFKIGVTKLCNQNNYGFQWQKSFYDHIIRNEESLNKIREYIFNNPIKCDLDRNNPEIF